MNRYISIFKIDGKPILPPLMTESVKLEMREYKKIACQLEHKYQIKRNFQHTLQEQDYPRSSDDSSSVELLTTYRKTESSFPDQMQQDSILDSSLASTIEEFIEQDTSAQKKNNDFNNFSPTGLASDEPTTRHIDCYELLEHFRSEMSKSVPPPVIENMDPPMGPLIRSNSYTLLTPSPMLLKQMELEGVEVNEHKKFEPKKLYSEKSFSYKTATKKLKPRVAQKKPTTSIHHKKSPYESSITPKIRNTTTKTSVVKLLTTKLPAKSNFAKENIRTVYSEPTARTTKNDLKVLGQLKDAQKKQLMELLARQKDEEMKLEEEFLKKHELILKQLQDSIITTHNITKHNEAVTEPVSQVLLQQYLDMAKQSTPPATSNNHNTHYSKSVQNTMVDTGITVIAGVSQQKNNRNSLPNKPPRITRSEIDKRTTAATIINAFVRGYLVRRLFKTEHVQKTVQVIRDTLIFVLDLHEESQNTNDPIDIVLKSRLLQQLSSACHTLHELFFSTTPKERMELIARDRDLMKTRIKRLQKLSNNNKYDFKISKKDNKIELYSIN